MFGQLGKKGETCLEAHPGEGETSNLAIDISFPFRLAPEQVSGVFKRGFYPFFVLFGEISGTAQFSKWAYPAFRKAFRCKLRFGSFEELVSMAHYPAVLPAPVVSKGVRLINWFC